MWLPIPFAEASLNHSLRKSIPSQLSARISSNHCLLLIRHKSKLIHQGRSLLFVKSESLTIPGPTMGKSQNATSDALPTTSNIWFYSHEEMGHLRRMFVRAKAPPPLTTRQQE
jgi:hypothetical protein